MLEGAPSPRCREGAVLVTLTREKVYRERARTRAIMRDHGINAGKNGRVLARTRNTRGCLIEAVPGVRERVVARRRRTGYGGRKGAGRTPALLQRILKSFASYVTRMTARSAVKGREGKGGEADTLVHARFRIRVAPGSTIVPLSGSLLTSINPFAPVLARSRKWRDCASGMIPFDVRPLARRSIDDRPTGASGANPLG